MLEKSVHLELMSVSVPGPCIFIPTDSMLMRNLQSPVHLRLLPLTGLLWLPLAAAYETWHLVDIAQVVCPKPTVSASAPTLPEYNVGINYTSVT